MPNKFTRIQGADLNTVVNAMNQNFQLLDQEVVTKQFKDNNHNTLITGNLGDGQFGQSMSDADGLVMFTGLYRPNRFGILMYQNGVPLALYGQAPDDGRIGLWIVPTGQNVLTLLGG